MKITSETLTDEQIHELLANPPRDGYADYVSDCYAALSTDATRRYAHESIAMFRVRQHNHQIARERCAARWNARQTSKP